MRTQLFNLLGIDLDVKELINKKNAVSWFEIPVMNLERASKFYSNVFEMKLEYTKLGNDEMMFFPMNKLGDGASGSLVLVDNNSPSTVGTLIYFYTADLDRSIKLVLANGGKLLKKQDIGKYGIYAHILDTEGNRIGIHMEK